jgi:hypothetical protein
VPPRVQGQAEEFFNVPWRSVHHKIGRMKDQLHFYAINSVKIHLI